FYTITVYFGAVGIKKIRHTLWAAIFADMVAIIMAVLVTNIML
ncbi:spore maturation protein, partial [Clostridium sporogenes]|nr:spore maturation protein [Clostridium sporogenes]